MGKSKKLNYPIVEACGSIFQQQKTSGSFVHFFAPYFCPPNIWRRTGGSGCAQLVSSAFCHAGAAFCFCGSRGPAARRAARAGEQRRAPSAGPSWSSAGPRRARAAGAPARCRGSAGCRHRGIASRASSGGAARPGSARPNRATAAGCCALATGAAGPPADVGCRFAGQQTMMALDVGREVEVECNTLHPLPRARVQFPHASRDSSAVRGRKRKGREDEAGSRAPAPGAGRRPASDGSSGSPSNPSQTAHAANASLTRALLRRHFRLAMPSLPEGRLCPPVHNRSNYVRWLRELLVRSKRDLCRFSGGACGSADVEMDGDAPPRWQHRGLDIGMQAARPRGTRRRRPPREGRDDGRGAVPGACAEVAVASLRHGGARGSPRSPLPT